MARLFLFIAALLTFSAAAVAQSLSFGPPRIIFPGALSDKSMAAARWNRSVLVAWKDTGTLGRINIGSVTEEVGTDEKPYQPEGALTFAAPVLQVAGDRLYLLWIGADSTIRYMLQDNRNSFRQAAVHTLHLKKPMPFILGFSTAFADNTLMIVAHSRKSGRLCYALSVADSSGIWATADAAYIKNARSGDYPCITAIDSGKSVRVSWADHRSRELLFADYSLPGKTWQLPQSLSDVYTVHTSLITGGLAPDALTFIGRGQDNYRWYSLMKEDEATVVPTELPGYIDAASQVAVASLAPERFVMAYTGPDRQLYASYAGLYDPASWMQDAFFPGKEQYTLKDIVIPGSHDAGMSVLSGVGGQGSVVINECNTLTQVMDIAQQLHAGIRMFDLRMDQYEGELFTKHAPADCMEDAAGGGYGEKLAAVLKAVRQFLDEHTQEFVLLSFCHFCENDLSLQEQAGKVSALLGKDKMLDARGRSIGDIPLKELAGKALVTFEGHAFPELGIDSNTMTERVSAAGLNYRRSYAATNQLSRLLQAQGQFFGGLKGKVRRNDLVRLDWQLTEASQEAIFICNDFESERSNPLLDGAILLANTIRKNKSIIELGKEGNHYLPGQLLQWIEEGSIDRENKPNILYVDVAGSWITDLCVELNKTPLYRK